MEEEQFCTDTQTQTQTNTHTETNPYTPPTTTPTHTTNSNTEKKSVFCIDASKKHILFIYIKKKKRFNKMILKKKFFIFLNKNLTTFKNVFKTAIWVACT